MNPYASHMDHRTPLDAIADTPRRLAELVETLGPERLETPPAPGKWSAAEIVCHLADCEIVFGFRLRQTLAEDEPTIEPFDQDKWAKMYKGVPANLALETFSAMRKWNLRLIKASLPAAANRKMTHPERGTMTFKTIVETMAGHDLNHLGQLRKLAGKG